MRGKGYTVSTTAASNGITPAYAGKSGEQSPAWRVLQDHPRICGEKCPSTPSRLSSWGSPPHMRGKAQKMLSGASGTRITPAYAGKRGSGPLFHRVWWDHPRICGEKVHHRHRQRPYLGSPPHMRGKVRFSCRFVCRLGITPAYAGKSGQSVLNQRYTRDHPRICGEKTKKIP